VQVPCPNDRIRRGFLPGSLKSVEVVFFAYVLKSINHNFFYKGHCEDLVERLKQHNSGHTKSIRPYLPIVRRNSPPEKKPSKGKNILSHLPAEGI